MSDATVSPTASSRRSPEDKDSIMSSTVRLSEPRGGYRARTARSAPTSEGRGVQAVLILLAVSGLAVLVFAPLAVVFTEALRHGLEAALESLGNPDARSAIRLTLTVAAIAVPLNAVLGIAAAWAAATAVNNGT